MATHQVVRLMQRPVGLPVPHQDLIVCMEPAPLPEQLRAGQLLLRTVYLSLDPAARGW